MRVLAFPARRNRDRNPFNFLLSDALAAQGCEVFEFDGQGGLREQIDIFHIHWPQEAARGRRRSALRKMFWLATSLLVQRLRGARIVWTVHNIYGHDQNNPTIERVFMWLVARLVHGLIFLTESSRSAACAAMPALAAKPFAIIPHGLYGNRSEKTREEARTAFGLPQDRAVIGFLGDIKRYKGLDLLLNAFEQMPAGKVALLVAGEAPDPDHRTNIRTRIDALVDRNHTIAFYEERLNTEHLVDAIRACDVVALPYRALSNSGLALLVLENRVPVVATDAPTFRELRRELGSVWVRIVDSPPTSEAIIAALATPLPDRDLPSIRAFCNTRSWPEIAAETLQFYRELGARATPHVTAQGRSTTQPSFPATQGAAASMPLVSVIIPVFNDNDGLRRCLHTLERQDYSGPYEVIVVNNGAPGDLDALAAEFPDVAFINEPEPGSYNARNTGMANANGSILAFTDADCMPDPGWLSSGIRPLLADPRCGLVGGQVRLVPRDPSRASLAELYDLLFGIPQEHYVRRREFAATANMLTRKDVVDAVGKFNSCLRSGGDAEWGGRVSTAGYELVYDDDAEVRHPARDRGELIKKIRRTVAGARDQNPGWRDCARFCLKRVQPLPIHTARLILRGPEFPVAPRRKALLLGFAVLVRWWTIVERLRLQLASSELPRS